MPTPDFVVVSGPPGSGKSTLAAPLARLLGLPLIEKDTIKDALMNALGVDNIAESRRIGGAAIATMFALARANGTAVLDSNWTRSVAVSELRNLGGTMVEVFCVVDPGLSRQRYLHRAADRHRGHFDSERANDDAGWQGEAQLPIGRVVPPACRVTGGLLGGSLEASRNADAAGVVDGFHGCVRWGATQWGAQTGCSWI